MPSITDAAVVYSGSTEIQRVYEGSTLKGDWITRTNIVLDPRSNDVTTYWNSNFSVSQLTGWGPLGVATRFYRTTAGTNTRAMARLSSVSYAPNTLMKVRMFVRASQTLNNVVPVIRPTWTTGTGQAFLADITFPNGESIVEFSLTTAAGSPTIPGVGFTWAAGSVGSTVDVTSIQVEATSGTLGPYFDGSTADTPGRDNSWSGTANASPSIQRVWTWL